MALASQLGGWKYATTGQTVMIGGDLLTLQVYSLGLTCGDAIPYKGRYPCGSLVYKGVWYYGTYCMAPDGTTRNGEVD